MKHLLFLFLILINVLAFSQGFNNQWLIGYDIGLFDTNVTSTKARLLFDANSINIMPETRKMPFRSTQANISDESGNLLFASNGCWIMNANKDTMLNGSDLNPGQFADDWCTNTTGMPWSHGNLIIPYPGDSTKFVLFHQNGDYNMPGGGPSKVFYTIIDITLAGGLGGVPFGQKNLVAVSDTLSVGIAACKHANGRDWWIIVLKDNSNYAFKILFTPLGISSITTQYLGNFMLPSQNAGQPTFSPNGKKFAFTYGQAGSSAFQEVRIFNFDRCSGVLDSLSYFYIPGQAGFGLAFSPDSKYLYNSQFHHVYQTNTDTTDIPASTVQVATFDGYCFPYSFTCTNFFLMYLAANGKIYISSGNGVIDMHYIEYPDSAGFACSVIQHGLHLPCYYVRGNVNHPNYYLGCDTTLGCTPCYTNINELSPPDLKFRAYPNPVSDGFLNIGYLLPQNKHGIFEMYDINGKVVFKYTLPPWSNYQLLKLPSLDDGIYQCVITSDGKRAVKKVAVIKQ